MTEKELHRLRRQDLLQLLLSQSKEVIQLRDDLEEQESENEALGETNERLKEKLDDKDEQIAHLKERLNDKDEKIENLKAKLDEKDALIRIMEQEERVLVAPDGRTAVRLRDLFGVAQSAAEEYLKSLRQ